MDFPLKYRPQSIAVFKVNNGIESTDIKTYSGNPVKTTRVRTFAQVMFHLLNGLSFQYVFCPKLNEETRSIHRPVRRSSFIVERVPQYELTFDILKF